MKRKNFDVTDSGVTVSVRHVPAHHRTIVWRSRTRGRHPDHTEELRRAAFPDLAFFIVRGRNIKLVPHPIDPAGRILYVPLYNSAAFDNVIPSIDIIDILDFNKIIKVCFGDVAQRAIDEENLDPIDAFWMTTFDEPLISANSPMECFLPRDYHQVIWDDARLAARAIARCEAFVRHRREELGRTISEKGKTPR